MALQLDWHTGWEAGPPPLLNPPTQSPADFCFATQDLWGSIDAVGPSCLQDTTGEGDGTVVHSGRFAYGTRTLHLGDHKSFTGHRDDNLSTKDLTVWSGWVNMTNWEGTKANTLAGDVYVLAHCGVQAIAGPAAAHLGLGYIIQTGGAEGRFCIVKYSSGDTYDGFTAPVAFNYEDGDGWVQWNLIYDSGNNTAYLYIRSGVATENNASDNALVGYAADSYSLPFNGIDDNQDKTADEGPAWKYDDWSGGKCDVVGDRLGWTVETQWYQPDGDTADVEWTPQGDGTNHWRNLDPQRQGDTCGTCTWSKPSGVGDDEGVTIGNDSGSPAIRSVRVIFDERIEAAGEHDVIARQSGNGWTLHNNPGKGDSSGGALEIYCDGGDAFPTCWFGWGSRRAFDGNAWAVSRLNAAECGVRSVVANNRVGSIGLSVMGQNLTPPAAFECPVARRRGLVV